MTAIQESKFFKTALALLATLVILMAFSPAISMANILSEEDKELLQLERDLEFLFGEASEFNGEKYILDEAKASEYFGVGQDLETIKIFMKIINEEEVFGEELVAAGIIEVAQEDEIGTFSWRSCMIDKILIGTGIGFISGGMQKLIDDKNWKKLSKEIIKIVGKNAVRGGVVGLTASLGVWSIACIGK
ncbi:hypothetical protein [Shouchella miscanthi]|uniref:Uncharacterized protein n=1 Tax=Shouchella miscanthi TaxID=2598861 RepID=A0ABU6NU01_9BACI|nr:hypothetical protein [Shouchella miscanthi]